MSDRERFEEKNSKGLDRSDLNLFSGTVLSYNKNKVMDWINGLPISEETQQNFVALELDGYDLCFGLRDEQIDDLTKKNEHEKNIIKREIENLFNEECKSNLN